MILERHLCDSRVNGLPCRGLQPTLRPAGFKVKYMVGDIWVAQTQYVPDLNGRRKNEDPD